MSSSLFYFAQCMVCVPLFTGPKSYIVMLTKIFMSYSACLICQEIGAEFLLIKLINVYPILHISYILYEIHIFFQVIKIRTRGIDTVNELIHFWWVDSETRSVYYYFKLGFVNNYSSLACEYSSETGWLANSWCLIYWESWKDCSA